MNILNLFKKPKAQASLKTQNKQGRLEIVLSGSGGQGIILAGRILAEAAAIYDNKEATMTQSYGPEARGGASNAEIIISCQKINYPKVIHADVVLAMTEEALDKYGNSLAPQGLLIVDETFIHKVPSSFKNVFKAPFSSLAIKLLDASIVANVIALGALVCISKAVSHQALVQAVLALVSKKVLVLDRMAVDAGYKVAEDSGFQWRKSEIER